MDLYFKYKTILNDFKKKSLIRLFTSFMVVLLSLGSFSEISAYYPQTPIQFAGYTGNIHVVTDENNHAMVAYVNNNGNTIATYYYSNGAWTAIPIATDVYNITGLVMDPTGKALLTFTVLVPPVNPSDDPTTDLHSLYFDGVSWNVPATDPLATSIDAIGSVESTLAMNASGLGVASWSDGDGSDNVRIAFFSGTNWGTPSGPLDIGTGLESHVAINNNGDVVIAWGDASGAVLVKQFIGGIWSTATIINPLAYLIDVGIADNGNSLALVREALTNLPVLANDLFASYFIGDTLNSTTLINPPQSSGPGNFSPTLQMSTNGTAVAAWYYGFGNKLYYAQFDGNVWAPAVNFQSGPQPRGPGVSINGNGDALIFWGNESTPPATSDFMLGQLPNGGTLTTPQTVYTSNYSNIAATKVSLADNGFNTLAWTNSDAFEFFFPFSLQAIPSPAVTNLNAFACNDRFASQQDCINYISWDPSTDPNVTYYDILRNDVYIATVLATDPLVYQDNALCLETIVYTILPYDAVFLVGDPASVTVTPCGCR